jgi:hypothetical protein
MNKPTYIVRDILHNNQLWETLRSGVCIALFAFTTVVSLGQENQYYSQIEDVPDKIISLTAKDNVSGILIPDGIEIFANHNKTSAYMTKQSFSEMMSHNSDAKKLEPVMNFIVEGIGNINIEKVAVDCDLDSEILNVVYRLPDNVVLSISKPLETIDDDFVAFNLYHNRKLLVTDNATIGLLSHYIDEVESNLSE